MEIEAKWRVGDADTLQRLRSLERLACFDVGLCRAHEVHDTYLDSPDRRMLAAGFACRRRQQGDALCITLKGLGGSDGAVHRRAELEMPLLPGTPDETAQCASRHLCGEAALWPAGPVREQVLECVADAPLVPLLKLDQTRTERAVTRNGLPVAVLSLDHVRAAAGERQQEYWELEIELLPAGSEDDLAAMVAALRQDGGLTPEPRSKFERGLALVDAALLPDGASGIVWKKGVCMTQELQDADRPAREAPQVVCLGEALIDLFGSPSGVPLKQAACFIPAPGGAPANVAVALSRLGVSSAMVGLVGADPFGHSLIELLRSEGVDTLHLRATGETHTTLAFVAAASPTEQGFFICRGADAALRPEDLDRSYLASARVLVYGSVTLSAESRAAARQAVDWAAQDGVLVVYDANLRPALWPSLDAARQGILEGIRGADICKLNERELELLTGTPDPVSGSSRILELGPSLCVVTLGSDGSYFNNGRVQGHVPAFEVEVVDSTGCGDAFLAGLVLGLLESTAPPDCLDEATLRRMLVLGNASGALTATQRGAMTALPTRKAVESLIASRQAA